jgi:hypothetical protein
MIIGYMENYKKCPLPKIEYRYIPRNFYEEQVSQPNLKNVYSDLFNKPDTWARYPLGNIENDNTMNISKNINNFLENRNNQNLDDVSIISDSSFNIEPISF